MAEEKKAKAKEEEKAEKAPEIKKEAEEERGAIHQSYVYKKVDSIVFGVASDVVDPFQTVFDSHGGHIHDAEAADRDCQRFRL